MAAQILLWTLWLVGLISIVGLICVTGRMEDEPRASAPPAARTCSREPSPVARRKLVLCTPD